MKDQHDLSISCIHMDANKKRDIFEELNFDTILTTLFPKHPHLSSRSRNFRWKPHLYGQIGLQQTLQGYYHRLVGIRGKGVLFCAKFCSDLTYIETWRTRVFTHLWCWIYPFVFKTICICSQNSSNTLH